MIQTPDDDDLHIAHLYGQSNANKQIRALQAKVASLEVELERYRSAPVVAWQNKMTGAVEKLTYAKWMEDGDRYWPLIIKPEES